MKTYTWYRFTFADGFVEICRGYSKNEMAVAVRKHGALISKVLEGIC